MKSTKTLKQLVFFLMLTATLVGCKEEKRTHFEINGSVENAKDDAVAILMNNEKRMDTLATAKIENGKFKMKSAVSQPTLGSLRLNGSNIELILENDVYDLSVKKNNVTIKGGALNELVYGYKYTDDYREALKTYREVNKRVFTDLDMMDEDAVYKAQKESGTAERTLNRLKNARQDEIITGDYPTLAKLYALSDNHDWKTYDMDKRIELYNSYDQELGGNDYVKDLLNNFEQTKIYNERRKSVAVGKPYKDVVAHTVNDEAIKLSEVIAKNKYTLLEFWASWCGPCRGQFPHLKEAYSKYNPKGFEIYGLSIDDQEKSWLKAIKEENVPWIDVVDLDGVNSKAAVDYVITGIPASFLIDQNGTIVATNLRDFALDKKLEAFFEE